MKRILLVATIYRVGERIYPIIPKLSGEFHIDVLKTAQMGNKINWYGDNDLRIIFDKKYQHYINNIYYDVPNLNNYDLILKWNRSLRFALAVCTLRDKFKNEL